MNLPKDHTLCPYLARALGIHTYSGLQPKADDSIYSEHVCAICSEYQIQQIELEDMPKKVSTLKFLARNALVIACSSTMPFELFNGIKIMHAQQEKQLEEVTKQFGELYRQLPKKYRVAIQKKKEMKLHEDPKVPFRITPVFVRNYVDTYKGFWEDEIPTKEEHACAIELTEKMIILRDEGDALQEKVQMFWGTTFMMFVEKVVPYITKQQDVRYDDLCHKMERYLVMPRDFRELLEGTDDKPTITLVLGSITKLSTKKVPRLVNYCLKNKVSLSAHIEDVIVFLRTPRKRNVKYTGWQALWR